MSGSYFDALGTVNPETKGDLLEVELPPRSVAILVNSGN